jgi:hypothetical protein
MDGAFFNPAITWGFLGIFSVVALLGIIAAFRWFKTLLTDTIIDARNERDRMSAQLDKQAGEFTEALKYRDDKFKEVADAIERVSRRK